MEEENEFEKMLQEGLERNKEIEKLALSFVEKMKELGMTITEYERMKKYLDKIVYTSKINS